MSSTHQSTWTKFLRFKQFLGKDIWKLFILAILIGFLWFVVESSFIVVLQTFLISIGLLDESKTFLPAWMPTGIYFSTGLMIFFGLFRGFVIALKYYFAVAASQSFISTQRARLTELSLKYAPKLSTSEVMLAYGEYTNTAAHALMQIAQLTNNLVSLGLFVCAGLFLTPKEFVLGCSLLALSIIPIRLLNRPIRSSDRTINNEKEVSTNILINGLKNNFFLQIYHLVDSEIEKGKASLLRHEGAYKRYAMIAGARNAVPQVFGSIIIAIITFVSLNYFNTPGGKLISFFYIFIRMAQAASDFFAVTGDMKIHLTGLKALFGWSEMLQKLSSETETIESTKKLTSFDIAVKNLSFSYHGKKVLENISLQLPVGGCLVLQGESGAGKSTLLSLILGLLKPENGEVKIGGVPSQHARLCISENFGYVGPEPYLIQGSVRENLLYGLNETQHISDEKIWQALDAAQIKETIQALPRQLDELMMEKTQLSTGQKQRLSIARALIRDSKVLILDEATANLDQATEQKIISLLMTLKSKVSLIIVTHKNSFNDIADQLIRLERLG